MRSRRGIFAITLSGTLVLAALSLGASTRVHAQSTPETPALYQRSYDAEALGDYLGALQALESIPGAAQRSFVYRLRHGWLLYLVGRYEEAITAYQSAIDTEPEAIESYLGIMLPQMALRRWQDAEEAGRHVLEVDPLSYLGRRRQALVLYSLGRYDAAADLYRSVLEHYPSDVEVQSGLAWCHYRLGDLEAAAALFRSVLEVSPNESSAIEGLQATAQFER